MKRGRRTKALAAILLHMKLIGKGESGIAIVAKEALRRRNDTKEMEFAIVTLKSCSKTHPEIVPPALAKDL